MSDDDDVEPTDSWRPAHPPPARAAGVPEDATWDEDAWRWSSGHVGGVRSFWGMNGALLQQRSGSALTSYYADGTVASTLTKANELADFASFYRDGKPWCVARYRNFSGDSVEAEQVVSEKLWTKDGAIFRELANEYDADGLIAHRERSGPHLRFENLRTADGRELRFYAAKDGALELTLRHKKSADKALALLASNVEVLIDGSEIGERTTRNQIEPQLGGRLFAATIPTEPQSVAVKAFTAKNAWAKKISEDAPFENASVANFLTALDSKLPHVAELAGLGLGNLIESDKHRNAVVPFLEALGTPAAKAALEQLGVNEGGVAPAAHVGEHEIGTVTLPSGILAIVDMGALGQWSHEAPHHADISGSKWAAYAGKNHDDYVDLVVTGPRAKEALAEFVASHGASDLFDIEKDEVDHIRAHFAEHATGATLEIAPERIGHGARLRLLRDAGLPYADFDFAHVNVVAVFGLPTGELKVVGEHDDEASWDHVSLVVKDTAPVREEEIARLSIEEARFLFADGEALQAWDHDRSLDGLRDFVFWGGMVDEMVAETGAELAYADANYYGWTDLPSGALAPHIVTRVLRQVEEGGLAAEVRPHSSHHAILRQAWRSADEAGTASIGGAKMCGLFSSVGDGVFPVYLEYDADGAVCRVTVKITGAPVDDEADDEADEDDEDDEDGD